ncbi:MAG TPA: thioester reductase domain-containing protein [Vicinamibacterales bacterium]|nr:thioester reductase domain-containing protein [Vicinamibacterales bacterium]
MTDLATGGRDVAAAIAAVAARCLRSTDAFDPDTPFVLLGMDSLGTIEMAAALEEALGCEVPPELLLECPDGRSLAARIAELRAQGRVADREDPYEQMLADAVLPPDIRPAGAASTSTDLRRAGRIFVTGATGFLGGALLRELLENTSAELVCLARSERAHDALALRAPALRGRIRVVTGDLAHPGLGLGYDRRKALATEIDAVLHCGAAVNWVYPYSGLRAANVLGTLELLRFACRRGVPFHFISSLSVCYSAAGPRTADETFDALPHLRGVQLGYAQTKIVGEALVRQAGARGLPARIYRPALISGDSATGAYNRDDLISALIRGCVRMGTAPDLDWKLDCEPVDIVAKAIVHLSGEPAQVFNLGHERPRHWRECVLWMRMYGYPMKLVPYHAWLRQLDRDTAPPAAGASTHPLRPLRTFFLDRHQEGRGLTLPELYEEGRRTRADGTLTRSRLARRGGASRPLDAALLETYFAALTANGDLPAPASPRSRATASGGLPAFAPEALSRLLGRRVTGVRVLGSGSDHSILGELTAWRSQRPSGLFHVNVELDDGASLDVRLKVKAADADVTAVGEALAELVDPAIHQAYARWRDRIGLAGSHVREIEIYRQTDRRFTGHAPGLLGSLIDDPTSTWTMALENVTDAALIDCAGDASTWTAADIQRVVDGLAPVHAIWFGREAELQARPWIGYVQTSAGMADMSDLWTALARHAAPAFSSWADPDIGPLQTRLIAGIREWWPRMEAAPRTLIHHDFNPRNLCLRAGRLCAYDWELATIGAPQRDLAEFLCFVLPSTAEAGDAQHWIDKHRLALEREAATVIDPDVWQQGFRAGLYDFMVNRLATYALIHRIRRQPFLPRVVRTWRRLYGHFPLEDRE